MKKTIGCFLATFICVTGFAQSIDSLRFTILQLNDVYEIAPLVGGTQGGMARVATLRKELLARDSNTITVLAGDFVSPSLIGTLSDTAEKCDTKVAGRHMVEVMNKTGVDYVTFGNHEFDIKLALLSKRLNESTFKWVNSNVWKDNHAPFVKVQNGVNDTIRAYDIHTFHFSNGSSLELGIIGVTLPFNKTQPVFYGDVDSAVNAAYQQLKGQCDMVVAITHLSIEEDIHLAKSVPGLSLILGGHEHTASDTLIGNVPICKADANAKSVYIHHISFDSATKKASIHSELRMINSSIQPDPIVDKVVEGWVKYADTIMKKMGYHPDDSLLFAKVPLEGRESEIRNHPTNYTKIIANALFTSENKLDIALFNSGSLRVDDQLPGTITEYDILRSLPFGGKLVLMNLKGGVLQNVLTIGTGKNRKSGGFLQFANASLSTDVNNPKWYIGNRQLDTNKIYKVLLPEFVAMGNESNLNFLKQYIYNTPSAFIIKNKQVNNDIRDLVINYLKFFQN